MDLFEAMETARAIRYFKPDPIPEDVLEHILYMATRAPSPGNSQGWEFIVVIDTAKKLALQDAISANLVPYAQSMIEQAGGEENLPKGPRLMLKGTIHLAQNLGQTPAIVLIGGKKCYPPEAPTEGFVWSALYPATQNLILAARGHGIGTCLTTYHNTCEADVRRILDIPEDVYLGAFIPMGYADAKFGPVNRLPLEHVVHRDGWQEGLRG